MEAHISQIRTLAATLDEAGRRKLKDDILKLHYELEAPYDAMLRIAGGALQLAMVRVGVDLHLFSTIASSERPMTVEELAQKTGAAPELLGRILRYLSSVSLISETGLNTFAAKKITSLFVDENMQGGVRYIFNIYLPLALNLPSFLQSTDYESITSNDKTVFQQAFNTTLPSLTWLSTQPELWKDFHAAMKIQRAKDWLSTFPLEKELGSWTAVGEKERVLFVDMGGSAGHQSVGFRKNCERLGVEGRVILQDLKETFARVGEIDGVEVMVQDFFEPQTIKGAKFYYLRAIFHDYPDTKCLNILSNILPALVPDSRILIDDLVLPNTGVPWQATQTDLTMMAALGAKERTKEQWYSLIEGSGLGLEVREIHTYAEAMGNSVIVVGLK